MHTTDPTTTTLTVDRHTGPFSAIDISFVRAFLAGEQPFSRTVHLDNLKDDAPLAPASSQPALRAEASYRTVTLFRGDGWAVRVSRYRDNGADVCVTAETDELAQLILDDVTRDAVEPVPEDDQHAAIGFWSSGPHGPSRREKRIGIRPWADIRRNYNAGVVEAFDDLMALASDAVDGRMLLLHGPPGTGKTTALRALAHAWRSWCTLEYVLDPERLLHDPTYLLDASAGDDEDKWALLVLEDCDEVIRGDAKAAAGQALSRLLNLTDGILGQGLDVLVALTTNEPLDRLHPAVVRPGRCLAQIEVGPLSAEEAARWLGHPVGSATSTFTVAELYEHESGRTIIEATSPEEVRRGYL